MSETTKPDLVPWERISGADLLQRWSAELKSACTGADEREWRDIGRAVILVVDSTERAEVAARRVAADAGMNFINIAAQDVLDLAPRAAFRKMAPALIWFEPGDWLQGSRDDDTPEWGEKKRDFQKHLAAWIDEFDTGKPVVAVTANHELGDMSSIIDSPGHFDRYFALPPVPLAQLGEELIDELGREHCADSLCASPAKLGKLVEQEFPHSWRRNLALLYLRRLYRKEQRKIEFLDLMHLATHGFVEEGQVPVEDESQRRQVAVHEAGHAAMAIIDSSGKNTPDYCSIVAGAAFKGIVHESISYHQSLGDRTTYATFRHQVRIGLAGRASEEIAFGPENVSAGASADLESARRRSHWAFARCGFAPGMTTAEQSASNLAVVVGDPTASESAHIENMIRQFLAAEYRVVIDTLSANRPFLDAIADRLMWDPIVDQNELAEIGREHLNSRNALPHGATLSAQRGSSLP